jgi:hypothetical protein
VQSGSTKFGPWIQQAEVNATDAQETAVESLVYKSNMPEEKLNSLFYGLSRRLPRLSHEMGGVGREGASGLLKGESRATGKFGPVTTPRYLGQFKRSRAC